MSASVAHAGLRGTVVRSCEQALTCAFSVGAGEGNRTLMSSLEDR